MTPFHKGLFIFGAAALAIIIAGRRMSALADILADRTGLGEAFMGAVFLGAATSLPGITASVTAAVHGNASLAISNAFGGIAVQTFFLALADITYKHANLEHAAASLPNILSGALLITLLSMTMLAMVSPEISFMGVHPVTPVLIISYMLGLKLIRISYEVPMWSPRITDQTMPDVPEASNQTTPEIYNIWLKFSASAFIVIFAGWLLTGASESIVSETGISSSVAGAFMLAVVTSLPELVTTISAVRRGALTLAVGGVLGGNTFDTLFAALADAAYRGGSIYHAVNQNELVMLTLTILMTAVLITGMLVREKRGIANIGFETILILVIYITGVLIIRS